MSDRYETKYIYAIFIGNMSNAPRRCPYKHLPHKVFAFTIQRYTHYTETGDGPV